MTRLATLRHAALLATTAFAMLSAPLAQAGGPQARPFKATLTTQEVVQPDPGACPLSGFLGTTTGQGNASHLGKVSLQATDCPVFLPGQYSFYDGKLVLTAANGDKLSAVYQGQLLPTSATSPLFLLNGNYTITGGTGRFAGATGNGVLQGSTNIATGSGTYEVSGLLSY